MSLQTQCMEAVLPADRPMYEKDPARSQVLLAKWPADYRLNDARRAERREPRWAALAGLGEFNKQAGLDRHDCVLFMHERYTPSGRRRLVVVLNTDFSLVYEPGGFFADAKFLSEVAYDVPELFLLERRGTNLQYYAGVPDSADGSRFSIPIVARGVTGYLDGQLDEENRVTITLRDASDFVARVFAARASAS